MSHYKSNLRDIQFNLFEVLRRQDLLGQPPYDELDEETVRGILGELERLATGPLAESFADADRNPPVFDPATHSVRIPESLRTSRAGLSTRIMVAISAVTPARPSSPTSGTARSRAGAPSGRLAGIGRR